MTVVANDTERQRLVLTAEDGAEAELVYDDVGDRLYLIHTGVPAALRGQGAGEKLVRAALDLARRDELTVVPWCPFARRWLLDHPEAHDGIPVDWATPPPGGRHG